MNRAEAEALDERDPLAEYRSEFFIEDGLLYMDGNSLGRLPRRTVGLLRTAVEQEWGVGLVRSWRSEWIGLPSRVGDTLAGLIGAGPGEVLIADQTSVNLYKLASAAQRLSDRPDIVSDTSNFPSDLYILEGVAAAHGGKLRLVDGHAEGPPDAGEVAERLDGAVALVAMSHVDYRSGIVADVAGVSAAAHGAGALTLWDLSHSAGVYPVDLRAAGVDLAVGCTYKYLNGGPGAPAFLFVRRGLQDRLEQPIQGWFGHADQFAFDLGYEPASGIGRYAVGTPPIISLRGAQAGIELTGEAGVAAIRSKSIDLTSMLIDLADRVLVPHGFEIITPKDPERRGGHVGIRHPNAWQVTQALLDREVVPDFRAPDVIRLGPAPLYTRFVDVWDAVGVVESVMSDESYLEYPERRHVVT